MGDVSESLLLDERILSLHLGLGQRGQRGLVPVQSFERAAGLDSVYVLLNRLDGSLTTDVVALALQTLESAARRVWALVMLFPGFEPLVLQVEQSRRLLRLGTFEIRELLLQAEVLLDLGGRAHLALQQALVEAALAYEGAL